MCRSMLIYFSEEAAQPRVGVEAFRHSVESRADDLGVCLAPCRTARAVQEGLATHQLGPEEAHGERVLQLQVGEEGREQVVQRFAQLWAQLGVVLVNVTDGLDVLRCHDFVSWLTKEGHPPRGEEPDVSVNT